MMRVHQLLLSVHYTPSNQVSFPVLLTKVSADFRAALLLSQRYTTGF